MAALSQQWQEIQHKGLQRLHDVRAELAQPSLSEKWQAARAELAPTMEDISKQWMTFRDDPATRTETPTEQ